MRGRGTNIKEKPNDFLGSIKKLLVYNKSFTLLISISLILSALSSIFAIIGPDKLKEITNIITAGLKDTIDMPSLNKVALLLLIIFTLSLVFDYLQGLIMSIVTAKFGRKVRKELNEKINKLPLSYFDKVTVGDVMSRVTNDVDTISNTLNQSLGTLVSALTMFIGTLIMMFSINVTLSLTAILSTVIGFIIMFIIMGKSQKYFDSVQNRLGDINGYIEEVYTGGSIVKVYNATDDSLNKFDSINDELFKNTFKSQFYSGLMHPIMNFISNFGYVAVCVVGAILTMNGVIKFGVIIAFMIYVRLFTNPLMQFASAFTQLQGAAAASERVFDFLELEEMTSEDNYIKLDKDSVSGNLEFKHVKFGYDEDKLIIKDFSSKIKAGMKVAIVGPTGAGKTTIVNLLMKFYNVNSGDIIIDNTSINSITRENVHDLFTMVLQDTWIFNGTIKENIRYNADVSDSTIEDVCNIVGLNHFVKTLPNGYDTILSDIDNLSLGQKQLITIARSMVSDKPFLILDEATSSVDTRTEKLVTDAMDKLMVGKTSFIIAHRLSTIKNADLILVIKDGNIIEQGNHFELLKLNGFYAELYNSQFMN